MRVTKNTGAVLLAVMILLLAASLALAQSSANYDLPRSTVGGGGGGSASTNYSLNSTVGQADAGANLTSSSYSLAGGFWGTGASEPPQTPFFLPLIIK